MSKLTGRKLALIGPPGSGKTTQGRLLAAALSSPTVDIDEVFARQYGDINAYFDTHGESAFREIESELILSAVRSDAQIIVCGGGAVLGRTGMNALRSWGDIVCLTASEEVLYSRIVSSDRPLKSRLESIIKEREPLYKKYADYTIDTSTGSAEESTAEIIKTVSTCRRRRYDTVLCDADDTVLDFKTAMRYSIVNTMRAVGVDKSDEDIVKAYAAVTNEVWSKLERGEITRKELDEGRFVIMRDRISANFDPRSANEIYIEEMQKTRFVIDGAKEFLRELRYRGVDVYIVTNSFARVANERLKALDGCVDGAFISEDIGYDKPNARFFEQVLKTIGVRDKSRVIVFGDSESSDIKGGINSGLDTCLYDPDGRKTTAADFKVNSYEKFLEML